MDSKHNYYSISNFLDSSYKSIIKFKQQHGRTIGIELGAGTVAGMASKIIEYPFDTVKVRMQTQSNISGIKILRQLLSEGAHLQVYKGMSVPLFGSMGECAVMFASYGMFQRVIKKVLHKDRKEQLNLRELSLASSVSGLILAFYLTPLELIKCRLQSKTTESLFKGPLSCAKYIVKKEGWKGFYRGNVAMLAREIPGSATYFTFYELTCKKICNLLDIKAKDELPLSALSLAGGIGGCVYWSIFLPVDTIKSQMQTELVSLTSRKTFSQRTLQLIKSQGFFSLWRGLGVTLLKAIPANLVMFPAYEVSQRLLNQHL